MTLVIGRLPIGNPTDWAEPMGDQIEVVGGLPAAGGMAGLKVPASLLTISPIVDTVANRQAMRRQFRSILNNAPLRLSALYITWDQDPEQNGWYVPDGSMMKMLDNTRYPDFIQKADSLGLYLVGRIRTHRRGIEFGIACRAGVVAPRYVTRDYLGRVAFGEYTTLTIPFAIGFTPANVSDIAVPPAASGFASAVGGNFTQFDSSTTAPVILSTSQDGGIVHFEQAESDRLKGDVVIRDRRGQITNPGAGPDTTWQEVYGPDWVSSEPDGRFTLDVPVLENGRCRVTYVAGTFDGFRVEVASGGAWVEQGIMVPNRFASLASNLITDLVSAQVMEWTPERGVLKVIMRTTADTASREECYITLARGQSGPRFECYPAASATGVPQSSGWIWVTGTGVDVNDSATYIASGGVATHIATATGAGPNNFSGAAVAATYNGENWVHLLRQSGSFCVTLSGVQANGIVSNAASQASVYGAAHNAIYVTNTNNSLGPPYPALGYCSVKLDFYAQLAQQIMEAEAMTLGSGSTAAADAGASGSGNNSVSATRTTDANPHTTQATWPNGVLATYRIFARVRTTASTLNIYAKTGATTGATKTTTSTSYVWIDLGEVVANNTTLEIHCWALAAATVWVDRIEAIKVQDRTATAPFYDGSRDVGFAHLLDVDPQLAVVSR